MDEHRKAPPDPSLKNPSRRSIPLDAVERAAFELFARAFARCGFALEETARPFGQICERVPLTLGRHGTGAVLKGRPFGFGIDVWAEDRPILHRSHRMGLAPR
jgi:hypothetical protein